MARCLLVPLSSVWLERWQATICQHWSRDKPRRCLYAGRLTTTDQSSHRLYRIHRPPTAIRTLVRPPIRVVVRIRCVSPFSFVPDKGQTVSPQNEIGAPFSVVVFLVVVVVYFASWTRPSINRSCTCAHTQNRHFVRFCRVVDPIVVTKIRQRQQKSKTREKKHDNFSTSDNQDETKVDDDDNDDDNGNDDDVEDEPEQGRQRLVTTQRNGTKPDTTQQP